MQLRTRTAQPPRSLSSRAVPHIRFAVSPRDFILKHIEKLRSRFALHDVKLTRARIKEFGWLAGGQIATLILSFLSIKLTTSIGPSEYGRYTLAHSITGIFSLAFFGPLDQGYTRFFFDYSNDSALRRLFSLSLLRLLAFSVVILVPAGAIISWLLHSFLGIEIPFAASASLMIMFALLSIPLNGLLNAMRLRREVAAIQVIERVLIIAFLFLLLTGVASNATMVMLAIGLATGVSLMLRVIFFRKGNSLSGSIVLALNPEEKQTQKEIYRNISMYSMPFVLWGAVSWLQANGERWVINGMLTTEDVGRYGLAANVINSTVVLMFGIFTQFISPIIFSNFSDIHPGKSSRGFKLIRLYSWGTTLLFVAAAGGFFLFGEMLIPLLSTKAYIIDAWLLFALTTGFGLFYIGQTLTSVGMALKKPQSYVFAKIATAFLSVGLYIAGCSWAGIHGVVLAVVAVNAVYVMLVVLTNRRLSHLTT